MEGGAEVHSRRNVTFLGWLGLVQERRVGQYWGFG